MVALLLFPVCVMYMCSYFLFDLADLSDGLYLPYRIAPSTSFAPSTSL